MPDKGLVAIEAMLRSLQGRNEPMLSSFPSLSFLEWRRFCDFGSKKHLHMTKPFGLTSVFSEWTERRLGSRERKLQHNA